MRNHLLLLFLFLLIAFSGSSQTYPSPQTLPYQQGFGNLPHSSTVYPSGWQGWLLGGGVSTNFKTVPPTSDENLIPSSSASVTTGGLHNFDGALGLLPTGTKDPALVLAINTLCNSTINISYQVSTMRNPGTRINELGLQFRVGASGDFIDIPGTTYQNDPNNPQTSGSTGQNPQIFTLTLPPVADNQPLVQIRWLTRDVPTTPPGTGGRASFSIDSISITASVAQAAFVASSQSICTGTSVDFTNTSLNSSSYEWLENNVTFSSANNTSRSFNSPGAYLVSLVADPGPCADTTTMAIAVAAPIGPISSSIAGETTVCEGATKTYSIPAILNAGQYHWNFPTGWMANSGEDTIQVIIGPVSGNVFVYASNACGTTDTLALPVNVNLLPTQPGPVSGKDSVCEAGTGIYAIEPVAGAISYDWVLPAFISGVSNTASITLDYVGPGIGTISVAAVNACGTGPAQSFDITVHPLPFITVDIHPPPPVCEGELITITASGADLYNWYPGMPGNPINIYIMTTTNYTVYGISINGCQNMHSFLVEVKETPQPIITQDGNILKASLHETYQWHMSQDNINWVPIPNANVQTYEVLEPGSYAVSVTDPINECVGWAFFDMPLGVKEFSLQELKVYPNPNNGICYINVRNERNLKIQISDFTGNNVTSFARVSEPDLGIMKIEMENLSPGIYWIQVQNENFIRTGKIIINSN